MGRPSEDRKRERLERRARTCEHFTGTSNPQCGAGIPYEDVKVFRVRPLPPRTLPVAYPCFAEGGQCALYSAMGIERVEAEEREILEALRRVTAARQAIVAETGGKRGVSGKMTCPVCKTGTLAYSVAGLNGHIWGACSTEGCVRWME